MSNRLNKKFANFGKIYKIVFYVFLHVFLDCLVIGWVELGDQKKGYTPFGEKFQQNTPFLKLFKNMPLFWNSMLNSIFRKSSYSQIKLKKKKKKIVQLRFMELEFHLKIFKELEFMELKFNTKTRFW